MADLEIGVIAEDDNDCEVIRVLIRRILEERGIRSSAWRLQKRAGGGYARLKRKAERWMTELAKTRRRS